TLVERHVVLRNRDEALLQQVIDVGARYVESDELRTLFDARRSGVGTRSLTADLGLTAAAVIKQLLDDQVTFDRPQRLIGKADRTAGRIAKAANAGRTFNRDPRVPETLALNPLLLGRSLVGDGLADFRVRIECRLNRVTQFHPECR